jgi:alkanesulfonate monooxygenase SsuD/methylene tetrahydromethanopterin reductase-like flavin-dependent oxidoreductase (luciferase family)
MMELGITLVGDATGKSAKASLDSLLRLCDTAQQCGLQTLWFTEHHHNPTRSSSSVPVLMGAVGARTALKLGAATLLPGLHDAIRIAEAMGTLEALYPGRMIWGFGKGGRSEIAHTHLAQLNPENARDKMVRRVQHLMALRDSDKVVPAPSHDAPWFIATRDPSALKLAARNNMGIMFGHKWPLEELVGIIAAYRDAHPEGKAPSIMLSRHFLCENDGERAQQRAVSHFEQRRSRMRERGRALGEGEEINFEESLIGTPEACRERLKLFEAMGVTHLSLRPVLPDHDETAASLMRLKPTISRSR